MHKNYYVNVHACIQVHRYILLSCKTHKPSLPLFLLHNCMYVCIHTYAYTCNKHTQYTYTHPHIYTHMYTCTCTHTHTHTYMHTSCIHIHTHTSTCTHTHIHIYTYSHTYTHTQTNKIQAYNLPVIPVQPLKRMAKTFAKVIFTQSLV